jgi:hypothetical protein
VTLRVRPGAATGCTLVLERAHGEWGAEECALVGATAGEPAGGDGALSGAIRFGTPACAGPTLLLPVVVSVDPGASPGRYKAPLEVRCGRRVEPLALLVEVQADG